VISSRFNATDHRTFAYINSSNYYTVVLHKLNKSYEALLHNEY
jgi:hypothetical protein